MGDPVVGGQREQKKLTYEELVKVCNSMQNDIRQLVERNRVLENNMGLARVGFLFEVVKLGKEVFEDVYYDAVAEISEGLYPSKPEQEVAGGDVQG